MVLVLNGVIQDEAIFPKDTATLFLQHPHYRSTATQLSQVPVRIITTSPQIGLLYVHQREFGAVAPHDKQINLIGSDDATTCIIAVVKHTGSGAIALAHLDGCGVDEAVDKMVTRVQELSMGYCEGRIELQMIGGYKDPNGHGEELFYTITQAFQRHLVEIDLTLCCVGELNTTVRDDVNWPIVYGIGANTKTGEIFPAKFDDKGPEFNLRQARNFTGGRSVLDIYDSQLGMIHVGPFNYDPLRGVDLWLAQPDHVILQHLSTSPQVEPPHFVSQTRATLKYIQDNPFPAITVFRDNRPLYFKREETTGAWQPVRY